MSYTCSGCCCPFRLPLAPFRSLRKWSVMHIALHEREALSGRRGQTNDTGDWRLGALLVAYALLNLAFHATRLSSFAWTNGLAAAMSEPRPRVDWSEQVVLVTGGAGGIGSAIVTALLKAECKTVVVVDRDEVTTEGVRSYKCDLTDVDQLTATIASIKKEVRLSLAAQ